MSGVKTRLEQTTDDTKRVESTRIEMELCHHELETCRLRLGELEQGEALLAGENRLLEMVAKGEALPSILDGICRLARIFHAPLNFLRRARILGAKSDRGEAFWGHG